MSASRSITLLLLTLASATAETVIHITGTSRRSEGQVLELMGGRLEHVRKGDATPSRADDAAFLVRQVLKKDGFPSAQVSWKIVSRNEIQLIVNEGVRLELGNVTVTGVPPDEAAKLVKLYARPAKKDHPLSIDSAPYRKEDEGTGLAYIRQELNAQGYWDAEAKISSHTPDTQTGEVNPTIEVTKGRLYYLAPARIAGPETVGEVDARALVKPFIGRPATTGNVNGMRLAVQQAFISRGYPGAVISLSRTLEGDRFVPEIGIDLGSRVRLDKIRFDGLGITQPERIRERLGSLEGEWYDKAEMNKRVRGFLATGAFSSVTVDTETVSEGHIDATLHFVEGKAREVTLAAGAASYQGGIFRVTYADRNLWGQLLGFSSGFEFSGRGVLGEVKITDPWLFGSDVSGTARLFALSYIREGYDSFETGIEAKTTWKWGDHLTLDALAAYSFVNLTADGLDLIYLGETVYGHPRVRATLGLDYRDSPVLPTKGWHLQVPFEIGAAIGEVTSSYVSGGVSGGWHHQFNENWQIGIGGELGLLLPTGDKYDMPIDLRFFNGGARSVRSFPERELGPTAHGYALGGEGMWNTNFQVMRTISGGLKGVMFLDAGTLSQTVADLPSAEIELAVGLGIRFNLPIGPVRLEYGYNLTKDPGEPTGTFHFAIGTAF